MRVLVTGVDSHFAQPLLQALGADDRVTSIVGTSPGRSTFVHVKYAFVQARVTDAAIDPLLAEHDALVQLTCAVLPARLTDAEMFDVNVRAPHKLLHAAHRAGVRRLVHVSTAFVYGEAVHANEHAQLKPLQGFLYAEHQAQLERSLAIELPECVRLRPHVILGPHAHPALKRLLRSRLYPRLGRPQPLMQCVHEDDVAHAVLLCLHGNARGAYNLASEDSLSITEALTRRHVLQIGLPVGAARAVLATAGALYGWRADPGLVQAFSHTLLINCRHAMVDLGWRSRYTTRATLACT